MIDEYLSRDCAAQHFGLWSVLPSWMDEMVSAIQVGLAVPEAVSQDRASKAYFVEPESGIAIIPLMGALMKGNSSFGGTSTVLARRKLKLAVADKGVRGIMLLITSPGGHVAGTDELANDVAKANESKPVRAHIDDLGASAAYWIASQSSHISANRMALIGSIGVVTSVVDSSKLHEDKGVKVHVISTGAYKGAGTPGTKVTKEHLAEIQGIVDGTNQVFVGAIASGRGIMISEVEALATGAMWSAKEAGANSLIDSVGTLEEALTSFSATLDADGVVSEGDTSMGAVDVWPSIIDRELAEAEIDMAESDMAST